MARSEENVLALSVRQKKTQRLPNLMVRSLLTGPGVDEVEEGLRCSECSAECQYFILVADDAAALELVREPLEIAYDLHNDCPIVSCSIGICLFEILLDGTVEKVGSISATVLSHGEEVVLEDGSIAVQQHLHEAIGALLACQLSVFGNRIHG